MLQIIYKSFKPYYKWITFNIRRVINKVLQKDYSFKPYYKWITFNIQVVIDYNELSPSVLNLIINGLPSIFISKLYVIREKSVLNLIINGLPSILAKKEDDKLYLDGFKPYYKWITFNMCLAGTVFFTGSLSFKPYYKWITFNIIKI